MFPFTRSNETITPRGDWSCGVMVTTADKRRYFFPGGEPELAMILARSALSDAVLNAPNTAIEFGTRNNNEWVREKRIKASADEVQPVLPAGSIDWTVKQAGA